jgi:hypothetical protein
MYSLYIYGLYCYGIYLNLASCIILGSSYSQVEVRASIFNSLSIYLNYDIAI